MNRPRRVHRHCDRRERSKIKEVVEKEPDFVRKSAVDFFTKLIGDETRKWNTQAIIMSSFRIRNLQKRDPGYMEEVQICAISLFNAIRNIVKFNYHVHCLRYVDIKQTKETVFDKIYDPELTEIEEVTKCKNNGGLPVIIHGDRKLTVFDKSDTNIVETTIETKTNLGMFMAFRWKVEGTIGEYKQALLTCEEGMVRFYIFGERRIIPIYTTYMCNGINTAIYNNNITERHVPLPELGLICITRRDTCIILNIGKIMGFIDSDEIVIAESEFTLSRYYQGAELIISSKEVESPYVIRRNYDYTKSVCLAEIQEDYDLVIYNHMKGILHKCLPRVFANMVGMYIQRKSINVYYPGGSTLISNKDLDPPSTYIPDDVRNELDDAEGSLMSMTFIGKLDNTTRELSKRIDNWRSRGVHKLISKLGNN